MALPAALAKGTVSSLGCVGNRVYTGLGEDELYVAVPGADLEKVAAALEIIVSANKAWGIRTRPPAKQLVGDIGRHAGEHVR